jgi:hypothetical protein
VSIAELNPETGRGVFVQKQRANVFTMMLILSFLNIIVGCLFLYLEMNTYEMKVKVPQDAKVPREAPAAAPGAGGIPGVGAHLLPAGPLAADFHFYRRV